RPCVHALPLAGIILLLIGGIIYTLGVPFYTWHSLPFRRAIWHGFVLVAAGVQYAAVLTGVVFASLRGQAIRSQLSHSAQHAGHARMGVAQRVVRKAPHRQAALRQ